MAELTKEQIERAVMVADESCSTVLTNEDLEKMLRAAAPFLQLPWDEPTEKDFTSAKSNAEYILAHALPFVRRRNASLIPKPVDPRIAIVRHQLGGASMVHDLDGVAVKILHALDQLK